MEFSFPWPVTQGETVAFAVAAFTVLWGLVHFLAPRLTLRLLRLETRPDHPEAVAEVRSASGFMISAGLCAILFAQPFLYVGLAAAWTLAAFGRIVSMLSDGAGTPYNWLMLLVALVLAILPAAYVFGFYP
jgi:hypothetical protein